MSDAANFHLWSPGEFLLFLAPGAHGGPRAVFHASAVVGSHAGKAGRYPVFFLQAVELLFARMTMLAFHLSLRQVRFAGRLFAPLSYMPALMPGKSCAPTESDIPAPIG